MDQLKHIGETLGGIKTLMLFQDEIQFNSRQCRLLSDLLTLAFDSVSSEMRAHLCFQEKHTKWKALESPLRELNRTFKEAEGYIRACLEPGRDWWAKAVGLVGSRECVETHVHNLLWCVWVVLEAVEYAGEFSGWDEKEIATKKVFLRKKYDPELLDKKIFQYRFGKLFLATEEICKRVETAWKEDMWLLSQAIEEKKQNQLKSMTKQQSRLADVLLGPKGKTHNATVLLNEYQVRRRLAAADNQMKEAQWYGVSFAVKHVFGELEPLSHEIAVLSSINHPNVIHCLYSFYDEEKKECFILAELMKKDLLSYMKEVCSPNRRLPFPLIVAVDIMLQIARGMEYLHSKKIYHGNLNPSYVLVKPKSTSLDSYLHVKVMGFELPGSTSSPMNANSSIWYSPEVLSHENAGAEIRCTEKADVYSFSMICFELLTGKVPFEDNHLHGDKIRKNIQATERPLFPFQSPKYLTMLTKKCWQHDPAQRPSFASICRILRYIKRFLILNPDHGQPDSPVPTIEYCDIETSIIKRGLMMASPGKEGRITPVTEVPYQMFMYKVVERGRMMSNGNKEKSSESESDKNSFNGCEENGFSPPNPMQDDTCSVANFSVRSVPATIPEKNKRVVRKKVVDAKIIKHIGEKPKKEKLPPQIETARRNLRSKSEIRLDAVISPTGRRRSGHASDSEVH